MQDYIHGLDSLDSEVRLHQERSPFKERTTDVWVGNQMLGNRVYQDLKACTECNINFTNWSYTDVNSKS